MKELAQTIQMLPVFLVLFALLFLVNTQIKQETIYQIFIYVFAIIIVLFYFGTWATKNQIFRDRIRVAVLLIFHFDIPFSNIESVREANLKALFGFHLNFIHPFSGYDVVQITRKHGLKVNIIPGNRTLFLENLNKAMAGWKKYYIEV